MRPHLDVAVHHAALRGDLAGPVYSVINVTVAAMLTSRLSVVQATFGFDIFETL
jgi:hypothetical protein